MGCRSDALIMYMREYDLGIFYFLQRIWVSRSQVRVRVRVKGPAIRHGFELYECLPVIIITHADGRVRLL